MKSLLLAVASVAIGASAMPALANEVVAELDRIADSVDRDVDTRRMSERDADDIRRELQRISDLEELYARDGLNDTEQADLDDRLVSVAARADGRERSRIGRVDRWPNFESRPYRRAPRPEAPVEAARPQLPPPPESIGDEHWAEPEAAPAEPATVDGAGASEPEEQWAEAVEDPWAPAPQQLPDDEPAAIEDGSEADWSGAETPWDEVDEAQQPASGPAATADARDPDLEPVDEALADRSGDPIMRERLDDRDRETATANRATGQRPASRDGWY